ATIRITSRLFPLIQRCRAGEPLLLLAQERLQLEDALVDAGVMRKLLVRQEPVIGLLRSEGAHLDAADVETLAGAVQGARREVVLLGGLPDLARGARAVFQESLQELLGALPQARTARRGGHEIGVAPGAGAAPGDAGDTRFAGLDGVGQARLRRIQVALGLGEHILPGGMRGAGRKAAQTAGGEETHGGEGPEWSGFSRR